jgi:hypothetical protein
MSLDRLNAGINVPKSTDIIDITVITSVRLKARHLPAQGIIFIFTPLENPAKCKVETPGVLLLTGFTPLKKPPSLCRLASLEKSFLTW